jgi:hypothetical protein
MFLSVVRNVRFTGKEYFELKGNIILLKSRDDDDGPPIRVDQSALMLLFFSLPISY